VAKFIPLIVAAALTVTLAGCAVSDDSAEKPRTTTTSEAAKPSPTPSASAAMTPLNVTVTDPDMGDSIAVAGIVRNFPKPASIVAPGEVILVQVTVTAGDKFYAGWNESGAVLVNGSGEEFNSADLDSVAGPMTAAGYTPFSVANENGIVHTGETGAPGWLTFIVDDAKGPLFFGTHHGDASISGGGSIKAATYKVQISE
jgi:hypothetical protein